MKNCFVCFHAIPARADGFTISFKCDGGRILKVQRSKMKLQEDFTHHPIPDSDIYPSGTEEELIRNTLADFRLPVLGNERFQVRDGIDFALEARSQEYVVRVGWHTEVPDGLRRLEPIVRLFTIWSKK